MTAFIWCGKQQFSGLLSQAETRVSLYNTFNFISTLFPYFFKRGVFCWAQKTGSIALRFSIGNRCIPPITRKTQLAETGQNDLRPPETPPGSI